MTLQDFFDALSGSEILQLSVGGQPAGEINEDNAQKLIPHIDLGLTALFARFLLKERRMVLQFMPDRVTYPITSKYAVTSKISREPVRYLQDDPADPFVDDISKIERVLTDKDRELKMNILDDRYSAHTPSMLNLRLPLDVVNQVRELPEWLKTSSLTIVCRATHPKVKLPVGIYDPSRVYLQLPDTHLEPLLYFVGARLNMPATLDNVAIQGNPLMSQYEAACQRLMNQGMELTQVAGEHKLHRRGFP